MNNLHLILYTIIHVKVTIHEITQLQEINTLHTHLFNSDHPQFHDHVKHLVLAFVIVMNNSTVIELHYVQDAHTFENNEKHLDLYINLLSETIVTVLFLDPSLETDGSSFF